MQAYIHPYGKWLLQFFIFCQKYQSLLVEGANYFMQKIVILEISSICGLSAKFKLQVIFRFNYENLLAFSL